MEREKKETPDLSGIEVFECLTSFRKTLFENIIDHLDLRSVSYGLDAGCATGGLTELIGRKIGSSGKVTGLDLSDEYIRYAKSKRSGGGIHFLKGDVTALPFSNNTFDWVWSADTVWPGPADLGCPAPEPKGIVNEYYRALKPGGSLYLVYWSSQKLLPGYPLLESRLNATTVASAPFGTGMEPKNHFMNARCWLEQAGFGNIRSKTFAGDFSGPLSENDKMALNILFRMLWGTSQSEVSPQDRKEFSELSDPGSDRYILNDPHYCGFYTYTLFSGDKK